MGTPVDRFSLEELQRLHNELMKQTKLHRTRRSRLDALDPRGSMLMANKDTFVETLRSIAELMIWGDQHEPRFFDFFLEKNVLLEFYEILSSPENRRGEIATQVKITLITLFGCCCSGPADVKYHDFEDQERNVDILPL